MFKNQSTSTIFLLVQVVCTGKSGDVQHYLCSPCTAYFHYRKRMKEKQVQEVARMMILSKWTAKECQAYDVKDFSPSKLPWLWLAVCAIVSSVSSQLPVTRCRLTLCPFSTALTRELQQMMVSKVGTIYLPRHHGGVSICNLTNELGFFYYCCYCFMNKPLNSTWQNAAGRRFRGVCLLSKPIVSFNLFLFSEILVLVNIMN